ncbi:hypothetical protein VCRA2119O147_250029 [Vibrio crassostreae]|nr:hypothetical protein VCRA2117O142_100129 [Vibrio crassostreae]CAK2323101.1 hypothetical protein VCRA2119O147_250029 [Vibrio crassostreae]CAK2341148.1 hypothetical protein VCRA2117O143_320020 [Vibrio crassostreae]CAK2951502.1 hypothetical protein VCRA2133E348_410030 [Vibrio crassostreae]
MNHADDPIVCHLHSVRSSNQQKASHGSIQEKYLVAVRSDRTAYLDTFRRVGRNQVASKQR